MFTWVCSAIALTLSLFARSEYRLIALIVTAEFCAHKLAYMYLFIDLRAEHPFLIYMIYAAIQVATLSLMYIFQSHFAITTLIVINLGYNCLTAAGFFHSSLIPLYYSYQGFVGAIMVLELIYLLVLTTYVRAIASKWTDDSRDIVDILFRVRRGLRNRSVA